MKKSRTYGSVKLRKILYGTSEKRRVIIFLMAFLFLCTTILSVKLSLPIKSVEANVVQTQQNEEQTEIDPSEIDVVETLEMQIAEYQSMMEQGNQEQLQKLICKTQEIIDEYIQSKNGNSGISTYAYGDGGIGDTVVPTAIATFSAAQFKLSAELLTVAYNNANIFISEGRYVPVYGGRTVTSSVTTGVANGANTTGSDIYEYNTTDTVNEKDLALAIHEFNFSKPTANSKIITITDTYDFDYKKMKSILATIGNGAFAMIEDIGAIQEFPVEITIDVGKALDLSVGEKINKPGSQGDNDFWQITVTNNTGADRVIEYNKKMCFEEDARTWNGLNHLNRITVAAGGSVTLEIQENGTACNIAFSFVEQGARYITSAFGISSDNKISKELTYIPAIKIIEKNGGNWTIRVYNNKNVNAVLTYNEKMCFKNDASNWINLNNLKTVNINVGDYKDIIISENGTAGYIALRLQEGDTYYYYVAHNLSQNGTMTITERIEPVYAYLGLKNNGKSGGKWSITISNPFARDLSIQYNKKMCFQDDAREWTNLNDWEPVVIPANRSITVAISTNWTAGYITACYCDNGRRIITYAHSLTTSGGINVATNQKSAQE